jgi:hypothetical protein
MYFGSNTTVNPKWTKQDKEMARIGAIKRKFNYNMEEAFKAKKNFTDTRLAIKSGILSEENLEAAKRLAQMEKDSALKYYEKAQKIKTENPIAFQD